MRERTFRKPSVRELFEMQSVKCPDRITDKFIVQLINTGRIITVRNSYRDAVETVENLEMGQFALFPSKFREGSDYGLKSLERLAKIDSISVLRKISRGKPPISRKLTRDFAERYRVYPSTLLEIAMENQDVENPPIGFYWVGLDKHVRATTWMRATAGAEMQIMKQKGDFEGKVLDKTTYGRNLRVRVSSRTEEGKEYEFTLTRLPMHNAGDMRQFSDWINIGHNSSDPDASYRGQEHDQRIFPLYLWSSATIFSFYDAMGFVKKHSDWKQFRVNPFPIPKNEEMIDFIDNLRLRALILDDSGSKLHWRVLSKREMDPVIGARTVQRYGNCWHHWGKRDHNYLYRPDSG